MKPRMCTQDWPAISVMCGVLQCSVSLLKRWYSFHRIFSSTSVHCEQECGRFCASVDVATKTPSENARNRVGSNRRRCSKPCCGITIPSSSSPTFCGMYRLWTCSRLCGKPWKSLSDMCGSNPKQRTICKRWFTFHWCQAFHHHFAEGHERAQKLMLQLLLGGQDCAARCLGQEAVLNRWRLSTRPWERFATITSAKEPHQGLAVMQALYRDGVAAVVPNPDYLHNRKYSRGNTRCCRLLGSPRSTKLLHTGEHT